MQITYHNHATVYHASLAFLSQRRSLASKKIPCFCHQSSLTIPLHSSWILCFTPRIGSESSKKRNRSMDSYDSWWPPDTSRKSNPAGLGKLEPVSRPLEKRGRLFKRCSIDFNNTCSRTSHMSLVNVRTLESCPRSFEPRLGRFVSVGCTVADTGAPFKGTAVNGNQRSETPGGKKGMSQRSQPSGW